MGQEIRANKGREKGVGGGEEARQHLKLPTLASGGEQKLES